jgi:molybdopterin/thiamine biosynthesis adenylyltransferase
MEKKGRELLEWLLELSGLDNEQMRQWLNDWIVEFNLDLEQLSTDDLRLLATCLLEHVSADLANPEQDDKFMMPQA